MGYQGPDNIKQKLTSCLDPKLLVDLSADLLFSIGFTKIAKTDGPGDGGRDLYALNLNDENLLVQCKFHENCELTCSTRDLSELPMALMKFKYSHGIFITNAKISPQAKREYLDNYEDFNLTFIDGDKLALSIMDSPLLKAVWFDGEKFHKVSTTIKIPLLAREHANDLPFIIDEHASEIETNELLTKINSKFNNLILSISSSRMNTDCFEPYKAPSPLTTEEGAMSLFSFSVITIEGINALAQLSEIIETLSSILLDWLFKKVNGVSIRFGKSFISARDLNNEDTKIELNLNPQSYIKTEAYSGKELDFINVDNSHWTSITDARVSEAEHIRLFCTELNVCLSYIVESRIPWNDHLSKIAMLENRKHGWNKSVFCLVESYNEWPYKDIPTPDESEKWIDNTKNICGWFDYTLLDWPSSPRSRSDDGLASIFKMPDDGEWKEKLSQIENKLSKINTVEVIEPSIARHMVAIIGVDPFSLPENVIYITGEVLEYPEVIPSPILPNLRKFCLEFVYAFQESSLIDKSKISDFFSQKTYILDAVLSFDGNFCHIKVYPNIENNLPQPTNIIINELYSLASDLKKKISTLFPTNSCIVTKEYWKAKYKVSLGINWEESDKTFGFTTNSSEGELMDYHEIMKNLTS